MPPGNPHGPLDARRQARRDLVWWLRYEAIPRWSLQEIAQALDLKSHESVRKVLMQAERERSGGRRQVALVKKYRGTAIHPDPAPDLPSVA